MSQQQRAAELRRRLAQSVVIGHREHRDGEGLSAQQIDERGADARLVDRSAGAGEGQVGRVHRVQAVVDSQQFLECQRFNRLWQRDPVLQP